MFFPLQVNLGYISIFVYLEIELISTRVITGCILNFLFGLPDNHEVDGDVPEDELL
jgi:uncharacterized membrane protein